MGAGRQRERAYFLAVAGIIGVVGQGFKHGLCSGDLRKADMSAAEVICCMQIVRVKGHEAARGMADTACFSLEIYMPEVGCHDVDCLLLFLCSRKMMLMSMDWLIRLRSERFRFNCGQQYQSRTESVRTRSNHSAAVAA